MILVILVFLLIDGYNVLEEAFDHELDRLLLSPQTLRYYLSVIFYTIRMFRSVTRS